MLDKKYQVSSASAIDNGKWVFVFDQEFLFLWQWMHFIILSNKEDYISSALFWKDLVVRNASQ